MDDLTYGKRNKRGDWSPNEPIEYRAAVHAAAAAQGVPEVAAALLPAVEPALRAVGGGLLGLDHSAGRDDADAEPGAGRSGSTR